MTKKNYITSVNNANKFTFDSSGNNSKMITAETKHYLEKQNLLCNDVNSQGPTNNFP
jgi:hypothetical protein